MATRTGRQSTSPGSASPDAPGGWTPQRVAPPKSRRRPALVALGVALAAVGALVAVYLVNAAGNRTAVVVVTRDVPIGGTIAPADLATVEVSVDPSVKTVPADQLDVVVGKVATVGLTAGALVAPNQFGDAGPVAPGLTLVPVSIPHSRTPATGLMPGDRVLVVDTPAQDTVAPTTPPSAIPAQVVRVGAPDLNGATVIDVTVAAGDGPALAARAATGRVAVVVQPRAS